MCGNIKKLRFPDRPATEAEIDAAVQQYLRKITSMRKPSAANQAAFAEASEAIAGALREMLTNLKGRRANAIALALFKPVD